MNDDLRMSEDELLSGYTTWTGAEEILAAGAAPQIIVTVTVTETTVTSLVPETPISTMPCLFAGFPTQ